AAAAQAAGAHQEVPGGAADARADALQIRAPHPLRLVVRVTHVVADRALLAADLTCARHEGGGGTTPRPTWQPAGATGNLSGSRALPSAIGACSGEPTTQARRTRSRRTPRSSGREDPG